jgi:hypothetical protein
LFALYSPGVLPDEAPCTEYERASEYDLLPIEKEIVEIEESRIGREELDDHQHAHYESNYDWALSLQATSYRNSDP